MVVSYMLYFIAYKKEKTTLSSAVFSFLYYMKDCNFNYTPCAIIASATFSKPAMFAPTT